MSIRSIEEVNIEIESLKNELKLLEIEKKKINFCQQYNISDRYIYDLKSVTGLNVNTTIEYHSEGEYSHLHEGCLEITFKRGSIQHKFRIDYKDYSPDDDGDRYSTSYRCDLYCTHPKDPIFKGIYNKTQSFREDEDYAEIFYIIKQIHN